MGLADAAAVAPVLAVGIAAAPVAIVPALAVVEPAAAAAVAAAEAKHPEPVAPVSKQEHRVVQTAAMPSPPHLPSPG